ncbi:DUF1801 domain-containing protein [bacterium]|nr:DUF1801 domain-containing protein [bacterium]
METTAAAQVRRFIGKYSPEVARTLRDSRRRMRALVPRGYELVYDNYNALAIGYGPGERASDAIVSLAGYPRWVTLFFLNGANLDDPYGLLEGTGRQARSIRLGSAADLDRPEVTHLVEIALRPHDAEFARCPRIRTVIKSISAKQRPRRPAVAG